MRAYRRFSNTSGLAVGLGAFVVLALILDSGGIYDWAQRLELGPGRTIVLPLATWLHRTLTPVGIEQRQGLLIKLARAGWSDDPAELAAANEAELLPHRDPASTTATKPLLRSSESAVATAKPRIATVPSATLQGPLLPPAEAPPLWTKLPEIPELWRAISVAWRWWETL